MGDKAYDHGKSKVTADLFEPGKDKLQNCETFIENLEKTRKRQLGNQKSELEQLLDATITPVPTDGNDGTTPDGEEVILDVNTKRFSKKDHIFMSFFSKYGENFIANKRSNGAKDTEAKTPDSAIQAEDEKLQKTKSIEIDEAMVIKERPVYNKADFAKSKTTKYQTKSAKTARQPSPLARLFSGINANQ